jgi:hypothetical protein
LGFLALIYCVGDLDARATSIARPPGALRAMAYTLPPIANRHDQ